jgi:hypothetical protein
MVPWFSQKKLIKMAVLAGLAVLLLVLSSEYKRLIPHPRVGLGISTAADPQFWAGWLGASWILDWRTAEPEFRQPEYWQMVRVNHGRAPGAAIPALEECAALAKRWPGGVWVIGNEPDNIWQDNVTAEDYARFYHDYFFTIKQADPSAKVAVAGVSQATPLRLAYLERVLAEYERRYGGQMPVDWWTLHGYVLREERGSWGTDIPPGFAENDGLLIETGEHGDVELFAQGIRDFRAWMALKGYREHPLALTEFGILLPAEFGYTPQVVAQYLTDTFTYLDEAADPTTGYPADSNRLVQRWAWFSLSDPIFPVADLADLEAGRLTPIGLAFRAYVQNK